MKTFSEWLDSKNITAKSGTFLETVMKYEPFYRNRILNETPHTYFASAPEPLKFLTLGMVDLGFENYDSTELKRNCYLGCVHSGVRIPGTKFKMRYHPTGGTGLIEPIEANEVIPELPDYWNECVLVVNNQVIWFGKRVRPDQIGNIGKNNYEDVGDGCELK